MFLLFTGWAMLVGTAVVADHVQDNKVLEASRAASAAGQHDLAKQLLCRSAAAKDTKECKEVK